MIYADNAATTKLDATAYAAMREVLEQEYANASQPYSFSRTAKKLLKQAREIIAKCIGALPEEIYFTSGGTESDNWAVKGVMQYGDGRAIITDEIEHHAVLRACEDTERLGYPVAYLSVDSLGIVQPKALESMISDNTKLVSVMLANNEIGTIEPVAELCEIAHRHGALFHTDAVQAVGHIHIDVKELGVDMLSASGHKFNGPKGVGFLYIKKGTKLNSLISGGGQERGMRAGTENVAAIYAMAVALEQNCAALDENIEKLRKMEGLFVDKLSKSGVDFIRNGAQKHLSGLVNISIKGASGEMLLHRLDLKKIYISTGSACDSVNTRVSHVIEAIGVPKEYAEGTIRVSFGKGNTLDEAVRTAEAIIEILGGK